MKATVRIEFTQDGRASFITDRLGNVSPQELVDAMGQLRAMWSREFGRSMEIQAARGYMVRATK